MHIPTLVRWTFLAAMVAVQPGCLASGVYRTAQTLEKGEGDLNLTFSATRFTTGERTTTDSTGKTVTEPGDSFVLPNIIPEVAYHLAITDDFEFGGRAALGSMLLEIDGKYRFLRSGGLHLAVAPALGYRALGFIEGPSMSLPLICTYEINDTFAFNLAPYVGYTDLSSTDSKLNDVSGKFLSGGASVGIHLRGKTFHFMPSVDVSKTLTDLAGKSGVSSSTTQNFVIISLSMGWVSGRELKKLESMDKKLDRIEEKLDSKPN